MQKVKVGAGPLTITLGGLLGKSVPFQTCNSRLCATRSPDSQERDMSPKRHRKCFTKARVTGDSQGSSWCFCVHRRAVTATIARVGHQGWDLSWVKVCVIPTSKKPRPAEGPLKNEVSLEGWEGRRWWVSLAALGPQQYALYLVSLLLWSLEVFLSRTCDQLPPWRISDMTEGPGNWVIKETCYTRCRPVPQIHYPWG